MAVIKNLQMLNVNGCETRDIIIDSIQHDIDGSNYYLLPGFVDVHVHFREPGFSYKETIKTGSLAAAHGGYTSVFTMPNLNPVPDTVEHLQEEIDLIKKNALIHVYPYGAITINESGETLADMKGMAENVIAFSDDGHGVQNDGMMLQAMTNAKKLGKIICAHCEDNNLLKGGYIHAGKYAEQHGHRGICSESEWGQIKRDLELVRKTGCSYHVCHISTAESVELIRQAKAEGLDVTCETGPHYLILTDNDLQEDGRFKMNPPLRSENDRAALLRGIQDGTIDMIATDHAPHSFEEKSRGLEKSAMGVVGLETAFAECYTNLVLTGVIDLKNLLDLLCYNPAKRFGLTINIENDYTIFDLTAEYNVDPDTFLSQGKATPFAGDAVKGKCLITVVNGTVVWKDNTLDGE